MKYYVVNLLLLLGLTTLAFGQNFDWKEAQSGGYTYRYVEHDPIKARFYTLKNGLTVILSPNHKEPRVAMRIAVRTGSNNDPENHTGLAHYLEHLLFKGTDKYGSVNYKKEQVYLNQIEDLYETYNNTTDAAKRVTIYKKIDSISGLSAKEAIAGEYDRLMGFIGSTGTNAHTWVEETIYYEDIPSGAMDKFLAIQSERFRNPVFRGFHTELETVYEEKNRGLDNDEWKVSELMHLLLFPTHNYGLQTTIGTIEHLKNPSLKAIREYYNKYYVPNNMALIMAGDFDADMLIKKIDAAFAYMKPGNPTPYKGPKQDPINGPIIKDVYGPSEESVNIAYRTDGAYTRNAMLAQLCSYILFNGKAGLFDLNLNKQQKVLQSEAAVNLYIDYGMLQMVATPKQGQSLEEVKNLLLDQVEKLKKGEFDASLIKAIVENQKLSRTEASETSANRAVDLASNFIQTHGKGWDKRVALLDDMAKVTKEELISFANQFFTKTNYIVINKKQGEDKTIVGVEKPRITPIETNPDLTSPFVMNIMKTPVPPVKPVWVDFKKDIQRTKLGQADILANQNKSNDIFKLIYHYKLGDFNIKLLPVALSYLEYLGTSKYSASEITKAFYNIAASFSVSSADEESFVNISGVQEHFTKAVQLFEELLGNCQPNETALASLKADLLKSRINEKSDKGAIAKGMIAYAAYGPSNPFNYVLSDEEIKNISSAQLIDILHGLNHNKHDILYYGPLLVKDVASILKENHALPQQWAAIPAAVEFKKIPQVKNKVYFTNYDAVQAEIYWIRNLQKYAPSVETINSLFNPVFGMGMSSIVFQTIREARAMAYSTYAGINLPQKQNDLNTFTGYVGTQADKMNEAIKAMNSLIKTMPDASQELMYAKENQLSQIETQRWRGPEILALYMELQKKGIDYDLNKVIYEQTKKITWPAIQAYHKQQLSGKPYTYAVIASDKNIKVTDLKKFGELQTLTLKEIFGY